MFGRVAQLNRVADYGSAGYRFESCRGHYKWMYQNVFEIRFDTFFLLIHLLNSLSNKFVKQKEAVPIALIRYRNGFFFLKMSSII